MNVKIQKSLDAFSATLEKLPLLSHVSVPIEGDVTPVKSWKEVSDYLIKQNKWLNFKNAISNNLSDLEFEYDVPDEVLDEIDRITQITVRQKMLKIEEPREFRRAPQSGRIDYHVIWDLGCVGSELILSTLTDDVPLFFTERLLPWYQKGHFPCGWNGKMIKHDWIGKSLDSLPEGQIRVY